MEDLHTAMEIQRSALFMMVSERIIQDTARTDLGAGEILEKTNAALCDYNQARMFVTVWLGILELSHRQRETFGTERMAAALNTCK